jgi:MSHA biogenesis protein MshK
MDEAVKMTRGAALPISSRSTSGQHRPDLLSILAAALLLAAQAAAQAQGLQDPTRPPAQAQLARPGEAVAAPSGPQLQSVLIARAPGGRQVAVIDGETVRLGDTFHGARLVRMTQGEVELVRGRERQVLKLNAPPAAETSSAFKR